MFELNHRMNMQVEWCDGSPIYIIDSFYANPDNVVAFLTQELPPLWKVEHMESSPLETFYEHRRHRCSHEDLIPVYNYLSSICGQPPANKIGKVVTNFVRVKQQYRDLSNDFFWWPHVDEGYNGIIYLNENAEDFGGTNLYYNTAPDIEPQLTGPQFTPWRPKGHYKLLRRLDPKYNRLFLFDGRKFFHGMDVDASSKLFYSYRINQIFFFDESWPEWM